MHTAQAIAESLAGAVRDMQELNGRLSESERAFVAEANARAWRPKGLPVAEIDATVKLSGGGEFEVTLAVWGTYHKPHRGGHEPGERAYEPDDPASFDVDCVMVGETDITGDLSHAATEAIAANVLENYFTEAA